MALLVEMVADRGMNGGEFLQTSHPPEALHCPFSSSERQMRVFGLIVQIASNLPLVLSKEADLSVSARSINVA